MRRCILGLILLVFLCGTTLAQSPWYEPNSWGDFLLQTRYNSNNEKDGFDYSLHYYLRKSSVPIPEHRVVELPWMGNPKDDTVLSKSQLDTLSKRVVRFNEQWILMDNPECSCSPLTTSKRHLVRGIYKYAATFYTYHYQKSWLSINPILNLQAGPKSQWGSSYTQNTRGLELRGTIDGKVGFYSRILENQWFAPDFVKPMPDSLGALPGVGWWRPFNKTGYDFFSAKGYINFAAIKNYVNVAFGHDKFFIGNGYRSLILSDFSKEYLFLKLNTSIGIFHYQNIFGQLNHLPPKPGNQNGDQLLPKKYMAVHRLSAQVTKWLELGATEMIVFDRDSTDTKGFELEYLNPIIFYRAVESNLGSRDNALIALDAKAVIAKKIITYGQLIIDEFRVSQVTAKNGWWANKFGWQLGAKTTLTPHRIGLFFLQAEMNQVKPYTYSHYRQTQSWTQYGQPLAHPLGANFRELVGRVLFQPDGLPRLTFMVTAMHAQKGMDSGYYSGPNYGGELSKINSTRISDFNVKLLQGNKASINNIHFQLSYMAKHNLWLDLGVQMRQQTGWKPTSGTWINAGLRWNMSSMQMMF